MGKPPSTSLLPGATAPRPRLSARAWGGQAKALAAFPALRSSSGSWPAPIPRSEESQRMGKAPSTSLLLGATAPRPRLRARAWGGEAKALAAFPALRSSSGSWPAPIPRSEESQRMGKAPSTSLLPGATAPRPRLSARAWGGQAKTLARFPAPKSPSPHPAKALKRPTGKARHPALACFLVQWLQGTDSVARAWGVQAEAVTAYPAPRNLSGPLPARKQRPENGKRLGKPQSVRPLQGAPSRDRWKGIREGKQSKGLS